MSHRFFITLIPLALALFSCDSSESDPSTSSSSSDSSYEDISINDDGTVRFYLSEVSDGIRSALELVRDWEASTVSVNGSLYTPTETDDGLWYVDVAPSTSGSYNAVLLTDDSSIWYEDSPYQPMLPYSQFWSTTIENLSSYPMFASYSTDNGNKLIFDDGFAVLNLCLSGSSSVACIKVENSKGSTLAGEMTYSVSSATFSAGDGTDFIVLNCSNYGSFVPLDDNGTHFYIPIAPGTYSSGLKISITDSGHTGMTQSVASLTLSAGEVYSLSVDYDPGDVVFYEGFDSFVWGGEVIGGLNGYAPDSTIPSSTTSMSRTGYEDSYTEVAYSTPGSCFIQSNTWSDVSGYTVGTAANPLMTASYTISRNLNDYQNLFRCQEYQGYLAVGTSTSYRGILRTPAMANIEGVADVELSFSVCGQTGIDDDLLISVKGAGNVSAAYWDGKKISLDDDNYSYTSTGEANLIIANSLISDGAGSEWHSVAVEVSGATSATDFFIAGNTSSSGTHGFYIDDITVTADSEDPDLRVLYWNIQNGMWADQANNYNNFVAWVKGYDPDVCVWCEAATIYKDNSSTSTSDAFLPDGWASLAARYGHSYTAIGGYRDNYPQVITSKYPISTLLKITDTDTSSKPVTHGAGLHQITVGDRTIGVVTLHLWPQSYAYGASDQTTSAANNEGDYYREYEMDYILQHTILSSDFSSITDWLMMGDFNARSRKDNWYYGYDEDDTRFLAIDCVLDDSDMVDVIASWYPEVFVSSTSGSARIDYMYASPSLYSCITGAYCLVDSWTTIEASSYVSSFYTPSDHRPIMSDLNF